jgi:hypothetical protein
LGARGEGCIQQLPGQDRQFIYTIFLCPHPAPMSQRQARRHQTQEAVPTPGHRR